MYIFKFDQITKITLSAFMIALGIILTRFTPLQNIAIIPFIRVSLGPILIIVASLLLGPIYGSLIGVLCDVLGYFMFDTSGLGYNPLFSITYILYGLLPGLLIYLLAFNKKIKFPYIQSILFLVFLIFITIFFSTNNEMILYDKVYEITDILKNIMIIGSYLISLIYFTFYFLMYRYFKSDKDRVLLNNISTVSLITLVIAQLIVGVIIKHFIFEVDILFLYAAQIFATLIEVLIGNFIITISYNVFIKKFVKNMKIL